MALNTAACKSLFLFLVRYCLVGCKPFCEDSGWLKKTKDKRQKRLLVNTPWAEWYLKIFQTRTGAQGQKTRKKGFA